MANKIIDGIRRIIRQGTEVREGAQVTRALIALLGEMPRKNLVDAVDMSQALLTDRVLQRRKGEPWPLPSHEKSILKILHFYLLSVLICHCPHVI